MRSRLALVLLCLLPACTVKCNTRGSMKSEIEKALRTMAEAVDAVESVTCPDTKGGIGTRVECQVVFKDGTRHPIDAALTAENGGTIEGTWKQPTLGAKARAALAERAAKIAGIPMTMRCGDDKVIALEGDKMADCTLVSEKDGSADVRVYYNQESGWTFRPARPTGGIQALTDGLMTQALQKSAGMLGGRLGQVTSTECPKLTGVEPGTKTECTVHFADGSEHRAIGDIHIDADGDLSVRSDWADLLITESVLPKLAAKLEKQLGGPVDLQCNFTGIQKVPPEGLGCIVRDASGRARAAKLAAVDGNLSLRLVGK